MIIKKGFTLAEVLVTLAIIGVVASLTIPTLIQNSNNQKYQTGLKKAVSVLNQALIKSIAENDTDASIAAGNAALAAIFKPYLSVLKDDGLGCLWLADGSKVVFVDDLFGGNCTSIPNPSAVDPILECNVIVDVNGDKGPNDIAISTAPSDIYILSIAPNAVYPVSTMGNGLPIPENFKLNVSGGAITGSDAYPPFVFSNNASLSAITGST